MIYASVYFTILYKDSQKLEKTRKYQKPMTRNQGVAGSCPAGTTKPPYDCRTAFLIYLLDYAFFLLIAAYLRFLNLFLVYLRITAAIRAMKNRMISM